MRSLMMSFAMCLAMCLARIVPAKFAISALLLLMWSSAIPLWAESRTIAVVPKFMNHPFFEQAKQGCEKAAQELEGTTCLFIGPTEPSEQAQIQILQDLVTRRVSGIAIAPANSAAVGRALRSAEEAGIPVVTWDSDLLAKDKARRKTYIGTENYKLGVELGKLLLEFKPQGGSLALLSGGTAAENLNQRMQGIRDTIQGRGFTEVAGTPLYCNDDSALAIQQLEDILGRHPELDAFISVGAWPLSVQRAYRLVAQKYQQRIEVGQLVVLSADTLPMQLQIVKDRLAHALVGQRPFQMGYRVVFALSEIIDGKSVQDPEYTGLDICRQQTVDSCVVR